jgi:SNF2 family DNA or RNA helicase
MSIIVSKANKALIVPASPALFNLFPEPLQLDSDAALCVLPHDLDTFAKLSLIGIKAPHPMLSHYDWPGDKKPFKVQKQTCAMATSYPRSYLLNDMGTGKTRSVLWAWDYLRREGKAHKLLIVCKLSNMTFTWMREAFATLPKCKVAILHGSRAQRLARLKDPEAQIFVINHDGLRVIEKELHARPDIDVLAIDELAAYRNNSLRSKKMRTFAERFKFVWGLTGRPMPNAPTDVWAQCRIVTPATVPKYFRLARDMLMIRKSQFVWVPKPNAIETAFSMMRPQVRFALDEVVELPPVISRTVDVDLSPEQDQTYKKLVREFRVLIQNKVITAVNAGAAMQKLLQVSCGYVYTQNPDYVTLDSTPRKDVLLETIEEVDRKLLVFVPFRHALQGLSTLLTSEGVDHAQVHGDTKDRDQIFNLFQNTTKYKVLLAHPACLAHGLTLTAANTIVWYCPTASLELYEQANARIRRVGQAHKQQVLHLQGTPVERRMYQLLQKKQKVQDQFLKLLEEATQQVGA